MSYIDDNDIKKSYYDILEISPSSTDSEIKIAYREKLLSTHPDKQSNPTSTTTSSSSSEIEVIKDAYRTLIDPILRKTYDESLLKSIQRQGFNVTGEGLDIYDLNDFDMNEQSDDSLIWYKDCPRCHSLKSICLTETDLEEHGTEDGIGGYNIIVQCSSCSLWIKVTYEESIDEDD
ncbi:Diphthamide biosynthesis protein 4 [Scheffersomyces coipomensis]|uniref:Diphthamide biosynthesis protein 4 n=1 Tax=Scheffersomyces coipomensis TaxID=1788519 RepID=UPI00315D7F41